MNQVMTTLYYSVPKPMSIVEHIKAALLPRATHEDIADITVGNIYLAVMLVSGTLGVAHREGGHGAGGTLPSSGSLDNTENLSAILSRLGNADPSASALGCAAAAALAALDSGDLPEGDVLDRLAVRPKDRVVMVGGFPIERDIRERGGQLSVYDRARQIGDMDEMPAALSRADLVVITATAIINNTIDDILEHIQSARETVILGPSTILVPDAFRGTPVTGLFGIIPRDPAAIQKIIAEGGGTRDFIRHAKKVEATVPEA